MRSPHHAMVRAVLALYLMAVVFGAIAAITVPLKLRRSLQRRLRSGALTISDGGRVTVIGTVIAHGELVASPISEQRGVLVITQAELPEIDSEGRAVVMQSRAMTPFELDTPQGVVLVDLVEADVIQKLTPLATRSAERERAFVASHGRGPEVASVATFRELVIAPGARIAVHGVAAIDQLVNEERGYRDAVPTRTRIVRPADYPITIGPPPSP